MAHSVSLKTIYSEFDLKLIYLPDSGDDIQIVKNEINRPGLPLSGFLDGFDNQRIQIIGKTEDLYLSSLTEGERLDKMRELFRMRPVAVIYTHGTCISDDQLELAKKYEVPILYTEANTSEFMSAIIASLNRHLAPCMTRHGVFVEVYGEGMLIVGDSGIGKSETAIELVKRGHRLIADDAVELKKVSAITILGSAPELIRHYIELRGIGVVDVCRLFGMGAVKDTEKVDLVIRLEKWQEGKMYDRLGIDDEFMDIMGVKVPQVTIPVHAGRNLAVILEIAAMNNRQKRMGYNTAMEFNNQLLGRMGINPNEKK
jgi:HPr kinase/phosphorylase